ncbi:hypothetical protein DICPUDRAFT_75368 [Dictyostelium purpureum]|uniref:C2 domain-containing protein n=1 Tax=Dictyostelium purpureum TaxID=5786 RepID=F0ZAH7_DICPU|nr:uncharacterized protein DICPUDRAFT_75368 [Dictyostelium purpureum]EGC39050.1 hypothetical protein DICPUDRAFT_75368 [Dictyostelium purpureum]|eukprot:XP_003284400.1 hypothetical protein DICPUDRAFT_75368 [Dictyostelium purpureum]
MIPSFQQPKKIRYELTIKCQVKKKSDLCVVLSEKIEKWNQVGRTEVAKNTSSLNFKHAITIYYQPEKSQHLSFSILDVSDENFEFIAGEKSYGCFNTTLRNLISSPGNKMKDSSGSSYTIEVQAHEVPESTSNIILKVEGDNFDKKDLFSSDPYFIILKDVEGHGLVSIYKSEIIKKCLSPIFLPINLKLCAFNSNDMNRKIKFEFYDHNKISSDELIGEFYTTTNTLVESIREFEIINPKKSSKSNYKNSGLVKFKEVTIVTTPTIYDYINGGFKINLMLGINCGASSENIHDISNIESNQYIQAIQEICDILKPYNTSGKINIQGFGCNHEGPNEYNEPCYCKPFKFCPEAPQVETAQNVVGLYLENIGKYSFKSPSNFSELIKYACKKVIFTHGEIPQCIYRSEAILAVHAASTAPISIIIVGVGKDGFQFTSLLDGDKNTIRDSKYQAWKRDCVQFVQFNHHREDPQTFAYQVIEELPTQFLSYVDMEKILPPR